MNMALQSNSPMGARTLTHKLRAAPKLDSKVTGLISAAQYFERVATSIPKDYVLASCRVSAAINAMCAEIRAAELSGVPASIIRRTIETARQLHAHSPFIKRLQYWPRGYPGDFETIKYLMEGINHSLPQDIGWYCEQQALSCPLAQQHRNKVATQHQLIRSAIQRAERVLCLAAGGAPDLQGLERDLELSEAHVVLNDTDMDALMFCASSLKQCASKLSYVCGNALQIVKSLAEKGPYSLIIAGGLFDYLPDRVARLLLRKLRTTTGLFADGATFWFSNIASANPFRCWIEYLADWRLVERSESDLLSLLTSSGIRQDDVKFETDSTGLAHLVTVKQRGLN